MRTKFGQKNPRPNQNILMGSKVMQGSPGVTWGQMPSGMPYETQIWSEEPQTGTKYIVGAKGHGGVTRGQMTLGMPYVNQIWSEEPQT